MGKVVTLSVVLLQKIRCKYVNRKHIDIPFFLFFLLKGTTVKHYSRAISDFRRLEGTERAQKEGDPTQIPLGDPDKQIGLGVTDCTISGILKNVALITLCRGARPMSPLPLVRRTELVLRWT